MKLTVRKLYLVLLIIGVAPALFACDKSVESNTASVNATSVSAASSDKALTNAHEVALGPELQAGITSAVTATPYVALVQLTDNTRLQPLSDEDPGTTSPEIRIEYVADVLETLRGAEHKQIRFYQIVEQGEAPMAMPSPMIITLCHDSTGYFWPGTGSVFPYSESTLNFAKAAAKAQPDSETIDAYCF